ncbi:hypothetical protein HK097_008363 [Rhizophlyctis rosea]|uniref:Uncharacterized protein n=1 Tax=Rhizophlyctis rosea TaxID=64517 RepID=A0AAD5X8G7_9FUNG|nr:hypothetical protein HK097_008363 [Rhizophlyctis rosea]
MKLFTHNMLQCHVKNCTSNNFPLRIEEAELEAAEAEFNEDFMRRIISRLDWDALRSTAVSLGLNTLPETLPEEPDEEFLKNLHNVIMEVG